MRPIKHSYRLKSFRNNVYFLVTRDVFEKLHLKHQFIKLAISLPKLQ